MDTFDRVRKMRQESDSSDHGTARAALEQAMSTPERTNRKALARTGLVAAGVFTVGAVVVGITFGAGQSGDATASSSVHPGQKTVAPPEMELASAVLTKAAELQLKTKDVQLQPGQFLRTTVEQQQMIELRTGWEKSSDPFNESNGQIIAAIRTSYTDSRYLPADAGQDAIREDTDFHSIEALGDEAAAKAAWAKYYVANGKAAFGAAAPAPQVFNAGVPEPVVGDYPTDPQQFLDKWTSDIESLRPIDETKAASPPEKVNPVHGLWYGLASESFLSAPASYRSTYLKALALTTGTRVVSTDGADSILEYRSSDGGDLYRVTIDNTTGEVKKVQQRYASQANADSTRPAFLAGTFDVTSNVSREVVDAAPAINAAPPTNR